MCLLARLGGLFPRGGRNRGLWPCSYAVLPRLLKRRQVQVTAPRPLSGRKCQEWRLQLTDDGEKLQGHLAHPHRGICGKLTLYRNNRQGGEELVIDCERPWMEWSRMAARNPRILIP